MGFMTSILLLFYSMAFRKHRNQKDVMPMVFVFAIVCFLLVLSGIHVTALIAVNVSLAVVLWMKNYYSFEYTVEE
jgi:type III secretory pathway component EscV